MKKINQGGNMEAAIETPIIISPFKRLLVRLGLKKSTRRHLGSNPFFPLEHPRGPPEGECPYGVYGDYLRVRGSDMLLRITGVNLTAEGWTVRFKRIYP